MEGVHFIFEEDEEEPAEAAEGEEEGDQAKEPRTKVPRTEVPSISLAPGIEWDMEWRRPPVLHRVFDKKALERLGLVDHFAQMLPMLSKRFSTHKSVADFELSPDHD
eukprot:5248221-Amphidinium_carterae.1